MPESLENKFESEVAAIAHEIEDRRSTLETEVGIESEKKIAREVIASAIEQASRAATSAAPVLPVTSANTSYLDTIDSDSAHAVNALIERIHAKGLVAAISEARRQSPYILDAFHDVLVDKLYSELKTNKYI